MSHCTQAVSIEIERGCTRGEHIRAAVRECDVAAAGGTIRLLAIATSGGRWPTRWTSEARQLLGIQLGALLRQ